jgi:hypothetical protein
MNPARLLPAFAKGYRLDLHDYGGHRGAGLLVSSGAGSMMAIMDHAPSLRWCLDIDHLPREGRLAGLLACAAHLPEVLVAFAGWFSITNPKPLFLAIQTVPRKARAQWHAYVPGLPFPVGNNHSTLEQFLAALSARPQAQ